MSLTEVLYSAASLVVLVTVGPVLAALSWSKADPRKVPNHAEQPYFHWDHIFPRQVIH